MFGYPLYYVIIYHDKAVIISELIADTIQAIFAYVIGIILYFYLYKKQINSDGYFWNDCQFAYLKSSKNHNGEGNDSR